jgi:hypothetical protein
MTFILADFAVPCGAALRMAGHTTLASLETALPVVVLVLALLVSMPRTGNESPHAFFRFVGRFPLVIRYFAVFLLFFGIQAMIEKFFG